MWCFSYPWKRGRKLQVTFGNITEPGNDNRAAASVTSHSGPETGCQSGDPTQGHVADRTGASIPTRLD